MSLAPAAEPRKHQLIRSGLAIALVVLFAAGLWALVTQATWFEGRVGGAMFVTSAWGLLLIASFTGWGGVIDRFLWRGPRTDAPLRAAWGMAATLAVGGLLCALSIANRTALLIWVEAGLCALSLEVLRAPEPKPFQVSTPPSTLVFALGVLGLAVVPYLWCTGATNPNPSDDFVAYYVFPKQILATGTFVDPFSLRRMASFGGKALLDALLIAVAPIRNVQMVDSGVSFLLLAALPLGWKRQYPSVPLALLLLLGIFIISLPDNRINTASSMSGAVMFVALYRTVELASQPEGTPLRKAALIGLVGAGLCTLRQNFILPAALFLSFTYAAWLFAAIREGEAAEQRTAVLEAASAAMFTCLFLAPWAALSFRSNRSFLFPLIAGNYHREYDMLRSQGGLRWLRYYFSTVLGSDSVVKTTPLLLMAGLVLPDRGRRKHFFAFWLACWLGLAYLVYSLPLAGEYTLARYYYGFMVAYAVIVCAASFRALAESVRDGTKVDEGAIAAGVLSLLAIVLQLHVVKDDTKARFLRMIDGIAAGSRHRGPWEVADPAYEQVQALVPPREVLFTMVAHPYWFDFSRNRIDILDLPGSVSPPPGMPLFEGADAVAKYLLDHGIRYFVFGKPDRPENDLYSRAHWQKEAGRGDEVWRISSRFYLACFDVLDGLAASRNKLFDDGHLVLVDLAAAPSAP